MPRRDPGFTLVELMVVIAIIAVIAAIAIPNLLDSRKAANERSAIQLMRAVHGAEILFKERDIDHDGRHQYSRMSGPLGPVLGVAQLPDSRPVAGYDWGIIDDPREPMDDTFVAVAAPVVPGKSGDRCFCVDETGVIRWAPPTRSRRAKPSPRTRSSGAGLRSTARTRARRRRRRGPPARPVRRGCR